MDFESFVLLASIADLDREPAAREHADGVEFRMDLADRPLEALSAYDGTLPVLATNRSEDEGGEARGPARLETLREAIHVEAVEAIDVELAALERGDGRGDAAADLVARAREHDVSIVVSSHDRAGTPSRSAMRETLEAACSWGDVGKLAVTATAMGESLDLLAVTHACAMDGKRVGTMAMGPLGRHTRAIAPVYGSVVGYAPVDASDVTAPGQYDVATLAGLVDRLRSDPA